MLNQETKRRIDSARDILVGKVPDPKAQVEQITTAMIYKFMDDMDKEAQELGGKARFFTNGYEKYSWTNIMDPKLGGHERLNIYAEAVVKMAENPHIPQLFRDIFKDSFLPYRSPETLSMFLKEINGFKYLHSEDLGDAFEYLLSVLGSQGDAGQFRTPRHIIDFIADVVDPKKDDSILDPACGTAGFLISAYKHILKQHKDKPLSPEDKKRMMNHIVGYDISPDMVKLSKVNMYLHGFPTPHIFEYDTLSSEEKWDETYDVIMANPPFMTPKGGIRPHKRFSVQANRAEVLFVNYIMEHLNNNGRAGIIVPEGIIFQSGNAYKSLRKMLVEENYLYAVVSLPAGVFNPYSGVKTSILFLDKNISKKTNSILFIKIWSDGFGLGAQRKPVLENDLLLAKETLTEYIKFLNGSKEVVNKWPKLPIIETNHLCGMSLKSELAFNDYNLSAERYKKVDININQKGLLIPLEDTCDIQSGSRQKGGAIKEGIPSIGGEQITQDGNIRFNKMKFISPDHYGSMRSGILKKDDVLVVKDGATTGKTGFYFGNNTFEKAAVNEHVFIFRSKKNILPQFLYYIIRSKDFQAKLKPYIKGIIGGISLEIKKIKIPLPSLIVQKQIVEEIYGYQKIIDGAKQVVNNWKPSFEVNQDWEIKNLVDVCTQITDGTHQTPKYKNEGIPFLRVTDITESNESKKYLSRKEHRELIKRCKPEKGDVLYTKNGTIGVAKMIDWDYEFSIFVSLALLKPKKEVLEGKFLEHFLNSKSALAQAKAHSKSGTVTNLHLIEIKQFKIPLPPLEIQKQIMTKIEEEQKVIEANKRMIEIFEKKIEKKIKEVWK